MITINFDKARNIAHEKRRVARSIEFAPYDSLIAKKIPGKADEAEQKRQEIRSKYEQLQVQIDAAKNVDELVEVVRQF
jgi:hypothetical protein